VDHNMDRHSYAYVNIICCHNEYDINKLQRNDNSTHYHLDDGNLNNL
jgi:hypothetical protein